MKNHNELIREPDIPTAARIKNPERPPARLLGSHPSALRLRAPGLDDDGLPIPDFPTDPEPPPPPVSTPDLAVQLVDIRSASSPCFSDEERAGLLNAISGIIGGSFENVDVRAACQDGTEKIGIWTSAAAGESVAEARERGLGRLDIKRDGETVAFFINASFIRRLAAQAWEDVPKRLNGKGREDKDGPIHLTGFKVKFQSPDKVITEIEGYDERPWPDVPFTFILTDTLSVSARAIDCRTEDDIDADPSWVNYLVEGLKFALKAAVLGLALTVTLELLGNGSDPDPGLSGIGCEALKLLPTEVPIPDGQKLVFFYSRCEVGPGGIFAAGGYLPEARTPSVKVSGPRKLSVEEGTRTVQRRYAATTVDMRDPSFSWRVNGIATSPAEPSTTVFFNTSGAEAGDILTRRVAVRATDADELTADGSMTVDIHVTLSDTGGEPDICLIKPWLPQCDPF